MLVLRIVFYIHFLHLLLLPFCLYLRYFLCFLFFYFSHSIMQHQISNSFPYLITKHFRIFKRFYLFIYLFIGREGGKEGEKCWCAINRWSLTHPHQGAWPATLAPTRPGTESETFGFAGWCPTHWATPVRAQTLHIWIKCLWASFSQV